MELGGVLDGKPIQINVMPTHEFDPVRRQRLMDTEDFKSSQLTNNQRSSRKDTTSDGDFVYDFKKHFGSKSITTPGSKSVSVSVPTPTPTPFCPPAPDPSLGPTIPTIGSVISKVAKSDTNTNKQHKQHKTKSSHRNSSNPRKHPLLEDPFMNGHGHGHPPKKKKPSPPHPSSSSSSRPKTNPNPKRKHPEECFVNQENTKPFETNTGIENELIDLLPSSCEMVTVPSVVKQTMAWAELYRPSKSSEICGNTNNVSEFKTWVRNRSNKHPTQTLVVLLHGPPGIGKTSMAHAILKEQGFQIYEINASLVRTSRAILNELHDVARRVTLGGPVAIILDEIDTIADGGGGDKNDDVVDKNKNDGVNKNSGTWSGKSKFNVGTVGGTSAADGVLEFLKWIKENRHDTRNWAPIVCIANEIHSKPMQRLANNKGVLSLKFFKPFNSDLSKVLNRIIKAEKLVVDEKDKVKIIESSGGDVRQLVGMLQSYVTLTSSQRNLGAFLKVSAKDSFMDIFKTVTHVLYNPTMPYTKTCDLIQTDQSVMNLLLHENYVPLFHNKWPLGTSKPTGKKESPCEHARQHLNCKDCKTQLKSVSDMAVMSDTLSAVDMFETIVPVYREDHDYARELSAGWISSAIRSTRNGRHVHAKEPTIKFTTFYTQLSQTKTCAAQLHHLKDKMSEKVYISQKTMDLVDTITMFKLYEQHINSTLHDKRDWSAIKEKYNISTTDFITFQDKLS